MKIFISHSHRDAAAVDRIASRLTDDGHDVWMDRARLAPGDNIQAKIEEGLEHADALIVVVSENSSRSAWVQREYSAIAFREISGREARIVPVRLDASQVPSYLADRLWIDLSQDFDAGLDALSLGLRHLEKGTETVEVAEPERPERTSAETRAIQIGRLAEALKQGRLTLVCGAGLSVEAGVPAWGDLLVKLLGTMMRRISEDHALDLGDGTAAAFHKRHGSSSLVLGKYLKNNLGRDFHEEVRKALYAESPTSSPLIDSVVALARPKRNGRPLDSIVTFNFDDLVEQNLEAQQIPHRAIFSEAVHHELHEMPIYHVHGYLPHAGEIPDEMELVFSEDAYHTQFIDPFSWSNLIQLNKLTQNTCLFLGISLTDPNMRRLLDVAWRKSRERSRSHYVVKRLPEREDVLDDVTKLLEEQDANALGLNVVWITEFPELPSLLQEIGAESA